MGGFMGLFSWYSRHRFILVVLRVFVLIHVCGYLVSVYTGIDRLLCICVVMLFGVWVDVRFPVTGFSVETFDVRLRYARMVKMAHDLKAVGKLKL